MVTVDAMGTVYAVGPGYAGVWVAAGLVSASASVVVVAAVPAPVPAVAGAPPATEPARVAELVEAAPFDDVPAYEHAGRSGAGGRRVRPGVALAVTTFTALLLGTTVYRLQSHAPVPPTRVAVGGAAAHQPEVALPRDPVPTPNVVSPPTVATGDSVPKADSTHVRQPKVRTPKDPLAAGHVLIERHVGVPTLHVGETMPLVAWLVDNTGHVLADGAVRWSSSQPSALDVTGGVARARHAVDEPLIVTARIGNKRGELRVRVVSASADATSASAPPPSTPAIPPPGAP